MTPAVSRVHSLALALFTLVASASANVTVVSGGGSALQLAVSNAADGDTLLVHAGSYLPFDLDGKSLAILGYPGETPEVSNGGSQSPAFVRNLAVGKTCVLGGVSLDALEISNCAGSVRVAQILPYFGSVGTTHSSLVSVSASGDVTFSACTLYAPRQLTSGPGRDAVSVSASNVAFYDCAIEGGAGLTALAGATDGGAGLVVSSSSVLVSSGSITGGAGGTYSLPVPPCGSAGTGGAGIRASGAAASVRLLGTAPQGGSGGSNNCTGVPAPAGVPIDALAGVVITLPGTQRTIRAPSAVREANAWTLMAEGQIGDQLTLLVSPRTRWLYEPLFQGVILYGPGVRRIGMGTLASNSASFAFVAPGLPFGVQATTLHLQCLFTDTGGQRTLSGPAAVVVFDSAF